MKVQPSDGFALSQKPFGCTVHRRGQTSTIELDGELDLAARPTLNEAVQTALEPGPIDTVVADFTRVTFADSTTIGWLVALDARMQDAGGRLVTVAGGGPMLELLRLIGLDRQLTLVQDVRMR